MSERFIYYWCFAGIATEEKGILLGTFISSENDFKLHLKRNTNSCFINNYNPVLLKLWQPDINLQAVYNYYKAVYYMTAYFSKSENSTSEATEQAIQEIKLKNL